MFSKRTAHRQQVENPRLKELREQLESSSAVQAMTQTKGWKALEQKLGERRAALLQELVEAKVMEQVPHTQARIQELDAIFKLVSDEIQRGEEAREQIERTLESDNG